MDEFKEKLKTAKSAIHYVYHYIRHHELDIYDMPDLEEVRDWLIYMTGLVDGMNLANKPKL